MSWSDSCQRCSFGSANKIQGSSNECNIQELNDTEMSCFPTGDCGAEPRLMTDYGPHGDLLSNVQTNERSGKKENSIFEIMKIINITWISFYGTSSWFVTVEWFILSNSRSHFWLGFGARGLQTLGSPSAQGGYQWCISGSWSECSSVRNLETVYGDVNPNEGNP